MLQIVQKKLAVGLRADQAAQIQQHLQARFNSLLAGVRLEYLRRLGVEAQPPGAFTPQGSSTLLAGEIFMPEPGTVCYVKIPKEGNELDAGCISNQPGRNFDGFFRAVQEAVAQVGVQTGYWQDASPGGGPDPEDAHPVSLDISEKELEAAQEFLRQGSRELLFQLRQNESLPLQKLNLPRGDSQRLLQHLEDLDLIRKDYAVFSKETGQQILKVASRTSLEESKFFSAENVDEVISCTSFCQSLADNDKWLQVLVLAELREMGLAQHGVRVLVTQTEGAPIQLFLTMNQQRFMLVLTGSKLTLDASYLISAQVAACSIQDVAVVSTQKIATLMRHHLSSTNPNVSFHFIDGLGELREKLAAALVDKQRTYLRDVLEPLSELTSVRVQELVVGRYAPEPIAEEMPALPNIAIESAMLEPVGPPVMSPQQPLHREIPAPEPPPPPALPTLEHLPPPQTEDPLEFAPAVPEISVPEPEAASFDMPAFRPPVPSVTHLPVDDFHSSGLGSRSQPAPQRPATSPSWPGELPLE